MWTMPFAAVMLDATTVAFPSVRVPPAVPTVRLSPESVSRTVSFPTAEANAVRSSVVWFPLTMWCRISASSTSVSLESTVFASLAFSTEPAKAVRFPSPATRSVSVVFAGSSPGVTFPPGSTIIPSGTTMTTPCMGVRCVEALNVQPYG